MPAWPPLATIGSMAARLRSPLLVGTAGWLLLVLCIGFVDLITGPEYGFGFFYLLAVAPAAWYLGRWPGLIVGLASGMAWYVADAMDGRNASAWPSAWNASSRLLVFLLAAWLIDVVRRERERLRTIDRDRSRFMQVLEHELGGPGRELVAGLQALERVGGASAEQLHPMVEQARDLEFLSRDFVSLGQLQSGALWLEHRSVDVRAIVEEQRARVTATPRMPLTVSTGAFLVEGDAARLRQAIAGLFAAARESAGALEVSIDLRRDRGNAKLTISAGSGPFMPFSGDERDGVGVELARMIIHGHGGTLDHRREAASRAVRFVVTLPLER